jgi:hypothetical protein
MSMKQMDLREFDDGALVMHQLEYCAYESWL